MTTTETTASVSRDVATVEKRRPLRPSAQRRVNPDEAFAYFLALGDSRSLLAVSRAFPVSHARIKQIAKRDNWNRRVEEIGSQAALKAEQRIARDIEARQYDTIMVAEKLRQVILDEKAEISPELAVRTLPQYAQLEQVFANKPTEIHRHEVVSLIVNIATGIDTAAKLRLQGSDLDAFREDVRGVIEQASGVVATEATS